MTRDTLPLIPRSVRARRDHGNEVGCAIDPTLSSSSPYLASRPLLRPSLASPTQFGPTAYTPGLRRVKVELRSEAPEDGPSSSALSNSDPSPSTSNPLLHRTPSSSSSSHGFEPNYASGNRFSPRAGGRSESVDSAGARNATDESRARPSPRDACFKTGRRSNFPVDELFEEL
jgi:hypothetical protein